MNKKLALTSPLALVLLSACGGGGGSTTPTPTPTPTPTVVNVGLGDAATVQEGGPSDTATLSFPFVLNRAAASTINIDYRVDGGALLSTTIASGANAGSISVARTGDDVIDGDETVSVTLETVTGGGTLDTANATGSGVIADDEQRTTAVFYEVADVGVVEAEVLKDTLSGAWGFVETAATTTKPGGEPVSEAATGQTGEGYLFWDLDPADTSVITEAGSGVLGFQIAVDQTDSYVLSARMRRPADATEEADASDASLAENTIWVRILDSNDDPVPSADPDTSEQSEWAVLTLSPAPRGEWEWATQIDVGGGTLVDAAWDLDADETYTVEISGRSENVQIDRLHLSKSVASTDETLAQGPTTEPTNVAPTASSFAVQTAFETAVATTLVGSDSDGVIAAYAISDQPDNGSLSGVAPNLTYTPDDAFEGVDTFSYTVSDDENAVSSAATVTITVGEEPNVAPVATDQTVSVGFGTATPITLSGTDANADDTTNGLAFAVIVEPANGTLSGTAPNLTYTPNSGYVGPDAIIFTVTDLDGEVDSGTITINVQPEPNQAPTAVPPSTVAVGFESATSVTLSGTDSDGSVTAFTVVNQPTNGTVTPLSGATNNGAATVSYTPNTGYSGADSFTFTVTDDDSAVSAVATVNLTVTNEAPTATPQTLAIAFNTPTAITLAGNDNDGSIVSFDVVSTPTNGALSGTAPNITYTPNTGFSGADSFTFTVTDDGDATSTAATISLTVTNQAPTATAASETVPFNTATGITLNGSDADGAVASFTIKSLPTNGALTDGGQPVLVNDVIAGTSAPLTYTPTTGFSGADSFTFSVTDDGGAQSSDATVSITVQPDPNVAPTVADISGLFVDFSNGSNTPNMPSVDITLVGSDADGPNDIDFFTIASNPSKGTLSGFSGATVDATNNQATITYTPTNGQFGADSFTFTATDLDSEVSAVAANVGLTIQFSFVPTGGCEAVTGLGLNEDPDPSEPFELVAERVDLDSPSTGRFAEICTFEGFNPAESNFTLRGTPNIPANVPVMIQGTTRVGQDVGATGASDGNKLTMPAGATIVGKDEASLLLITRGSEIDAEGTAGNPVVFTSLEAMVDELRLSPRSFSGGSRGEWGGVVISGQAPINVCNDPVTPGTSSCENNGVGNGSGSFAGAYGGGDPDDTSGEIRYAQILYAGSGTNNLNGLTLQGVGNGTPSGLSGSEPFEFIHIHKTTADGLNIQGGLVNLANIVITDSDDESIVWGDGWNGNMQYAVVNKSSSGDFGIEAVSSADDQDVAPRSHPVISNLTLVGSSGSNSALFFRSGTGALLANSVIDTAGDCIDVNDDLTALAGVDVIGTDVLNLESVFMDCGNSDFTGEVADASALFNNTSPFFVTTSPTIADPNLLQNDGARNTNSTVSSPLTGTYFPASPITSIAAIDVLDLTITGNEFDNRNTGVAPEVAGRAGVSTAFVSTFGFNNSNGAATQGFEASFFDSVDYVGAFSSSESSGSNWANGWTFGGQF